MVRSFVSRIPYLSNGSTNFRGFRQFFPRFPGFLCPKVVHRLVPSFPCHYGPGWPPRIFVKRKKRLSSRPAQTPSIRSSSLGRVRSKKIIRVHIIIYTLFTWEHMALINAFHPVLYIERAFMSFCRIQSRESFKISCWSYWGGQLDWTFARKSCYWRKSSENWWKYS